MTSESIGFSDYKKHLKECSDEKIQKLFDVEDEDGPGVVRDLIKMEATSRGLFVN